MDPPGTTDTSPPLHVKEEGVDERDSEAGKKVFPCEREGCQKVFRTLGHLVRHERSHAQDLRYGCTECDKRFVRSDVLARHILSIHGEGARDRGKKSKSACTACAQLRLRCDSDGGGVEHSQCLRCRKLGLSCVYKPRQRRTPNPSGTAFPRRASTASESPIDPENPVASTSQTPYDPSSIFDNNEGVFPPSSSAPRDAFANESPSSVSSQYLLGTASGLESMLQLNATTDQPAQAPPGMLPPRPPSVGFNSFSANRANAALQSMPPFDFSFSSLPYETYRADVAASFDNSLGWGMGNTELDLLASLDHHHPASTSAVQTPSTDWLQALTNFSSTASTGFESLLPSGSALSQFDLSALGGMTREPSPERETMTIDASPVDPITNLANPPEGEVLGVEGSADNPWPHVYQPLAPLPRLALPPVAPTVQHNARPTDVLQITEASRNSMIALVEASHKSPWQDIAGASFPSASTIQILCNLYFQRFHPTFPILVKSQINKDTPPTLLLAIAAIGATYSSEHLEGLGVALTELTRRAIQYLREIDPRLSFEVWVIQSWTLHAIFGLYCGSRKLYQHSEISRCGLVTAARRMSLLQKNQTSVEELHRRKPNPSPKELYNAYLEDEERLRLGWGIYLFDNQIASLLNLQSLFSLSEITAVLPDDDERFEAPNVASWASMPKPERTGFKVIVDSLLKTGNVGAQLNPFGTSIIAFSLFRICIDAAALDSVLSIQPDPERLAEPYRLTFSPAIKHNPQLLLDSLAVSWFHTATSPTALLVASTALSHHAAIQFCCGDLLNQVKLAAGRGGPEGRISSRAWIEATIVNEAVAIRRVLVHAAQLNALLMRFTFDTPSEVVWLADVAMILWAIVKFGREVVNSPTALQQRTAIKWSDTDNLEPWIQHGGPVSLKGGLGDFASLTASRVLSEFVEKLESLPWGLSRKFGGVLMGLQQEEERTHSSHSGTRD